MVKQWNNISPQEQQIFLSQHNNQGPRKVLAQFYLKIFKDNYSEQTFHNNRTNMDISIVRSGIKDSMYQGKDCEKWCALRYLKPIIEQSYYMGQEPNRYANKQNVIARKQNIQRAYTFACKCNIMIDKKVVLYLIIIKALKYTNQLEKNFHNLKVNTISIEPI